MKIVNTIIVTSLIFFLNTSYSQQYADSVIYAIIGGPNNTHTNLNTILGAPEVGNIGPDIYLALGGGFVVIDMGVYIINDVGADLKIYEAGTSYPPVGGDEPFYLLGNQNNTLTGWRYLGSCTGDICEIDFDSLDVNNIRYIAIFDKVPEAATTHTWTTPGADIDAIEALHFQTTSIEIPNQKSNPKEYNLLQNFPNPFNPTTTIKFSVSKSDNIRLAIYDALGRQVREVLDEFYSPGEYNVTWDGKDESGNLVSSGQYFYTIESEGFVIAKKMILMR